MQVCYFSIFEQQLYNYVLSILDEVLTLFVHLAKSYKVWNIKKVQFILGIIKGKIGDHHCANIKEHFLPYFHVSVGENIFGICSDWCFPSQPFHLDVLETNDCFISIFGKCRFHITTQQTPTGQGNKSRFLRINTSSDVLQMPEPVWKRPPGALHLNACAHYIIRCVMFWYAKYQSSTDQKGWL